MWSWPRRGTQEAGLGVAERAVVCSGPGDTVIMKGSAGLADSSPGAKAWFPPEGGGPLPMAVTALGCG